MGSSYTKLREPPVKNDVGLDALQGKQSDSYLSMCCCSESWTYSKELYYMNLVAFYVHSAQAIAATAVVAALGTARVPVTITYAINPPGTVVNGTLLTSFPRAVLYEMNPQWLAVSFLYICALAHGYCAVYTLEYDVLVARTQNWYRWVEYSFSASIMMVNIGMVNGVTDFGSLFLMFFATFAMIWFGYYDELDDSLWAFVLGSICGLAPWIITFLSYGYSVQNAKNVPVVVHFIVAGLFFQFSCFAVIALLNRMYARRPNKIVENALAYARNERKYIVLSLTAKTSLAWAMIGGFMAS